MNKKILLFSIGSIQEFIINSRKVLDLYNSSQMLSNLIKEGIKFIKDKYNGQILLPYNENKVDEDIEGSINENLPNYFIMLYESDEFIGDKVEKYVVDTYIDYFKENITVKEICEEKFQSHDFETISKQLDSSLDIYWVEYELEKDFNLKEDYKYRKVYKEINEYFEAIKNVRKFKNINEKGNKCSICGIRNGIFLDKKLSGPKSMENECNFIHLNQDNNSKIYLKKNEILCSVCLLKRFYSKNNEDKRYSSLAGITLSGWIKNVKQNKADKKQYEIFEQNLKECIKNKPIDLCYAMYKENWDSINIDGKSQKKLEKNLEGLKQKGKFPKYYCVYRMDIDNLGKWISGLYMENDLSLYEYQRRLSKGINKFFNNVRKFMDNECSGELIYAGGDDLLALIPINEIFKVCNRIREEFEKITKNFNNITYSQGIFIAHYKSPLGEVIRVSQNELQQCKERFKDKVDYFDTEKDGTVISIMTEGYNSEKVYFKNYINNKSCIKFILDDVINYFRYSSTYFHDELKKQYINIDKNLKSSYKCEELLNMLRVEQKRMMKRSFKKENSDNEYKDMNDKLIEFLKENIREKHSIDLENYFNLFYIIRKLEQIREGIDYEV